ncbi:hypothetical protein BCR33DRAFT_131529 [Rhizoclosmatium globosum]|uniref:Receptor ligand binding region domain-containing protein n=1 Tax=Rhizoclosmatium globosum TaxID=329046 RepID=A0A1Y2CHQ6_9FUNG|nr:hypothetical protein BCR33DRAFT_131529 [Rhizoclosmatium globosum]|eukprot:ORY46580.1 hypothetical protein BCR33DRAFT_131529 [Rhizoclosmatium globosum]
MCTAIPKDLKENGLDIVAFIESTETLDEIGEALVRSNARYIILCDNPDRTADVYFGLAKRQVAVGDGFVWLSVNIPAPPEDADVKYGKDFMEHAKGIVVFYSNTTTTNASDILYKRWKDKMGEMYNLTDSALIDTIASNTMAIYLFDCIGILTMGMDRLVKTFQPELLASRSLQVYMNSTLFQNVGYHGVYLDPYKLTDNGDHNDGWSFGPGVKLLWIW